MSDIVERLRQHRTRQHLSCSDASIALCDEAADEVERLRAALQEVTTTDPPGASDDWFQEWKHLAFRLKGIARRALEGK